MAGTTDTKKSTTPDKAVVEDGTDIELIKSQLERLREDFSHLGEMVGLTAKQRFANAKDQIGSSAEVARERAVDQFTATMNETEATVRRNPLTALAVVLGIGYILGAFSRK